MSNNIANKKPSQFIGEAFVIESWASVEPLYNNLLNREIDNLADLHKWLLDRSEFESHLQEDMGWRYIRMTCDTTDEKAANDFNFFINEIEPKMAPLDNELNLKMLKSPVINQLDKSYDIYIRDVKERVEIYRDENVPLFTQIQSESQQYAVIAGAMTVNEGGKEITLQQASNLLRENDRSVRENIYHKIANRRLADKDKLDELFNKLVELRNQVSLNADYANFRDYMFAAMGRFDYTAEDCYKFHEAIAEAILPITEQFDIERKTALGYVSLRPWDKEVDVSGKNPLKPFNGGEELMDKTIECFSKLNPYLGECMKTLKSMKHIDLESRIGKAPGGYNYPLYESDVPFIFMNSTNSLNDLVTMVHEGGHAVHSISVKDLEYVGMKSTPSEVAELASMSMELISMEYWDVFFKDAEELKRAKRQHLEDVIKVLPWVATIDKFQHWIYLNPKHTPAERTKAWKEIYGQFASKVVDWSGLEANFSNIWQKQLHLYEVPFYYIEYGMAQLGAIAMWRSYKQNPDKALKNYMSALKLGYTKSIGDIYKEAGIKFDFSKEYVSELAAFVKEELALLNK
jgi:oligoendopeptidase F